MMQPYRLINTMEMEQLTQQCALVLEDWNKTYSLVPAHMTLAIPSRDFCLPEVLMIDSKRNALAFIEKNYVSVINQILFGADHVCFNTASQELILNFFTRLFDTGQCEFQGAPSSLPNWLYPGSTSLLLTLRSNINEVTIILNPDWAYHELTKNRHIKNNTRLPASSDEALSQINVRLCLELHSFKLSVNHLARLQAGDVISSDHDLSTALRVTQGEHLVAQAQLGQQSHYKSIILEPIQERTS